MRKKPPLECPILALSGKDDLTVNYNELVAWKKQTSKEYATNLIFWGTFFS